MTKNTKIMDGWMDAHFGSWANPLYGIFIGMKLDAATYHDIINLTTNVAVSPAETWKKCLLATADEKMKLQRSQLTVNLLLLMKLKFLRKRVLGWGRERRRGGGGQSSW